MADAKSTKRPALFYTPTSCGAASFMAAHRAGLELDAHQVDMTSRTYVAADGSAKPYGDVNPKGNVPAIAFDAAANGGFGLLNENVATLSWIADQNLSAGNGPANGTAARYALQNMLSWLATELHQAFTIAFTTASPLRNPNGVEQKNVDFAKTRLERAFGLFEKWALSAAAGAGDKQQQYLLGADLTVADLYAHVVLGWSEVPFLAAAGVSLKPYPLTSAYLARVRAHPDVVAAQKAIATNPRTTKPGAAAWPKAAADAVKK